jgi:hypothetical protein
MGIGMAPEETLADMIAQRRLIQVLSGLGSEVTGLLFCTTQLAETCQPLSLHAWRHFVPQVTTVEAAFLFSTRQIANALIRSVLRPVQVLG